MVTWGQISKQTRRGGEDPPTGQKSEWEEFLVWPNKRFTTGILGQQWMTGGWVSIKWRGFSDSGQSTDFDGNTLIRGQRCTRCSADVCCWEQDSHCVLVTVSLSLERYPDLGNSNPPLRRSPRKTYLTNFVLGSVYSEVARFHGLRLILLLTSLKYLKTYETNISNTYLEV